MSVPAAYASVILIWATTPLAIKWSSEGPGFLLGVTGRMVLGLLICLVLIRLLGLTLQWRAHRKLYVFSGLTIYGAMMSVYWAAQYVPSGLISVIYGLSPIITGVMAGLWLQEGRQTPIKLLGLVLGISGLAVIFADDVYITSHMIPGIVGVLLSTFIHCFGGVTVKRIGAKSHPLVTVCGGLLVAVPLYLLTCLIWVDLSSVLLPLRSLLAITYLGSIATVVGFAAYYYVLSQVSATKVALITLITPVLALLIGAFFNAEPVTMAIWIGTGMIIQGLSLYLWGDRILARVPRLKKIGA